MTAKQAKRILKRYHEGTASEAETALLEQWYLHTVGSRLGADIPLDDAEREATWAAIQARIAGQGRPSLSRRLIGQWPYITAAAVAIAVLSITWLLNGTHDTRSPDIRPGGNKATLTLSDGRVVDLDEAKEGIVVGTDHITYTDGSNIALSPAGGGRGRFDEIKELVLSTPQGGTYQVILPDGSKVWLNANSTLKYPDRFTGGERVVEIEGEGYFAIAKDTKRPFKVRSALQEIEVLGTEFNLSAYADEPETKTTLVAGKVKVAPGTLPGTPVSGIRSADPILTPGQQAVVSGATIRVGQGDIRSATAWKHGRFSFTGKPFAQVMNELGRWYAIAIVYEGPVPDEQLLGGAYRTDDFATVLQLLESGGIAYRLQGRTLTIVTKEGGTR